MISTSRDSTAIVWEYCTGRLLRTYLLPASPLSSTIDPADRAFYVGYDDGSVQLIDFFKVPSVQNILHDTNKQSTPSQLSSNERWLPPSSDLGAADCLTLSYDGTSLISGHKNGAVVNWDVAKGRYASTITTYPGPVTNLQALTPVGFLKKKQGRPVAHNIIKPKYDHALSNSSQTGDAVPSSYTIQLHLSSQPSENEFTSALHHPFFPPSLISEGLSELSTWGTTPQPIQSHNSNGHVPHPENQVEDTVQSDQFRNLEREISLLKKQVSLQESARHATVAEMTKLKEHVSSVEDYNNELHQRQQRAEKLKLEKQERKEERLLSKREAWFVAEKKGENGDEVVKGMMETGEDEETSESDLMSDDGL